VKGSLLAITLCSASAALSPAVAQQRLPGVVTTRSDPAMQARHEIFVMERVLEQKVQYGAQRLNEQLRAVGMPEIVLLAGAARARGTRLEGYGVYFDLEVPAVRQSVSLLMSLRSMNRPDPDMAETLRALRNMARDMNDEPLKSSLESLIVQVETRMGLPRGARGGGVSALSLGAGALPDAPPGQRPLATDPAEIYTNEVRSAVIDAMFDHSGPMNLGAAEWLTIGARDDMDPRVLYGDPNDVPRTMIIRVRGADLAAFREGRLTREEAVQRVEVTDF
jgi:hypothetical protein